MQALRADIALIPREEYGDFLTQAEQNGATFVKLNASGTHVAVAVALPAEPVSAESVSKGKKKKEVTDEQVSER